MRAGRAPRGAPPCGGTRGAEGPHSLIHTNNSPKRGPMRASGRYCISIQDDAGVPLAEVFDVLEGRLSPLEFLLLRRADAKSTRA
jgi:hypothetical protein